MARQWRTKTGDDLDPVVVWSDADGQDGLDFGVVAVRDTIGPREGKIAADHQETAVFYDIGNHLAAFWIDSEDLLATATVWL